MADAAPTNDEAPKECFVMMPFSDVAGYQPGHFARVYRDIIQPACLQAGFVAKRVDENAYTGLIHSDIVDHVVHAPIALCDLSGHRGNVLFELGMRQAFDKPVVLIQDDKTERLFDISGIRTNHYKSTLLYADVVQEQAEIARTLRATKERADRGEGFNSIVRLLGMERAEIKNFNSVEAKELLQSMKDGMSTLREEVASLRGTSRGIADPSTDSWLLRVIADPDSTEASWNDFESYLSRRTMEWRPVANAAYPYDGKLWQSRQYEFRERGPGDLRRITSEVNARGMRVIECMRIKL